LKIFVLRNRSFPICADPHLDIHRSNSCGEIFDMPYLV
jgi:hypothetical protein